MPASDHGFNQKSSLSEQLVESGRPCPAVVIGARSADLQVASNEYPLSPFSGIGRRGRAEQAMGGLIKNIGKKFTK